MQVEAKILTGDAWWQELKGRLLYATTSVKVSMFLFSPNWHDPRLDMIREFSRPASKGVQCRIILSAAPMRIKRRRPNIETAQKLVRAGWDVRIIGGRSALHEKVIVIDDTAVFIGSHNLSYSSATTNYDTSVLLEGREAAEQASILFWSRWKVAEAPEAHRWEIRTPIDLPFAP
jgi:phosphatidylserine/phosphatidylglycerophosphate/cardiolipin synthase-like enzyme